MDIPSSAVRLPEHAGYLPIAGVHLYTVLHEVANPKARVLLVGPFASARQNAYLPWVRWARYLAERQVEVLRYDYRGVGESTGIFEEMTFDDWAEDIEILVSWLKDRPGSAPLVLHGLEIGALLAGRAFHQGHGDALLMWSPPANAHRALRSTLLRWINLERFSRPAGDERSATAYIQELEQKSFIEVEGYRWSKALWRASEEISLPAVMASEESAMSACGRPVRIVQLERQAAPLVKGGFVGYDEAKDFNWLFAPNCDWITSLNQEGQGDAGSSHAPAQAIPGRKLIELPGHGVTVRGTLHWSCPTTEGRTGIVFLNSLSLPRTATGDSAVYWADCLASAGYPSFRLDLPGLGDSGGAIPVDLLDYINAGEYAAITAAKVKELVERFALSGLVLAGHCAGAVTAMYAATGCIEECKGLLLLDPYFHLPQAVRPAVRRGLTEWAMRSRLGGLLSSLYDRLRKVWLAVRGNELPQNANRKLLLCWKKLTSSGVPILLFKAPARKAIGQKPRTGEFDYLSYVLGVVSPNSQVQVKFVEETDHSFANSIGRAKVAREIKQWLLQIAPAGETNLPFADSSPEKQDGAKQLQLNCLHG